SQLTQRRGLDLSDNLDLVDTTRLAMNALLPNAPNLLMRNLQLDDVRIAIGDDVWLRSPEANLKLGGQLRVTRAVSGAGTAPQLALSDSLTVERGTYQLNLGLARPTFEVERGLVRFFGDPDLTPTLDIAALHTIRETRANSNQQFVRIRVNIGGTVDRPTLALTSADNPPLPESDMLSYLVTGEPAYTVLGSTYAEQGATLALRLAGSYLSSRLAGGRFDVVQVEPTALNPGDAAHLRQNGLGILASTRVGVGGQVARNTFLTFSTGLCGLAPQGGGGSGDALSLFAQGLGVKVERRFEGGLSVSAGVEPGSSAQTCGRLGVSRTFQQTPPPGGGGPFPLLDIFPNPELVTPPSASPTLSSASSFGCARFPRQSWVVSEIAHDPGLFNAQRQCRGDTVARGARRDRSRREHGRAGAARGEPFVRAGLRSRDGHFARPVTQPDRRRASGDAGVDVAHGDGVQAAPRCRVASPVAASGAVPGGRPVPTRWQ
ncbi:MAG: translocation/assembly module TamB domain-containing protein, partial [Gemmatimonas sp.]